MKEKSIPELFDLSGKTAVVTGGAMGIGYGIVKRLAEAGANVVIADLADEGEDKVSSVESDSEVVFIKTNVAEEKDVQGLFSKTADKFGQVDILVNNAGIFPSKNVLEMDLDFWEKTMAVNLRGVFLCSREAGKLMTEKGRGNIVNIASIDALHPSQVGLAAYDASKHGVWGFTKNFALEVAGKGVRVNAVAPGGISTEGVEEMMGGGEQAEKFIKDFEASIPMGRFGEPDDIAKAVLFLVSDAAGYMTGEMIVVDGGVLLS